MKYSPSYFFDKHATRYTLCASNGSKPLNWLFVPGGPGIDSSYLLSLIDILQLSGNIWLLDLPGNGSNKRNKVDFEDWFLFFIAAIKQVPNPVIVGHSVGAMLALLTKECEHLLQGFIILNSAPCLWQDAANNFAQKHNLYQLLC
jgi:pimeloyl-ACP methyl ester carboxylesterase